MAIAALDGDRGHPAEPVFRRVGPVARDLRPKNGSRLAFVACISLGRNPRRSCGDHACADRHSLGRSRLFAHAHPILVAELLSSIHPTPANQAWHDMGDPIKACSQRSHYAPASGNGRGLLSVWMARQRSNELDCYRPGRAVRHRPERLMRVEIGQEKVFPPPDHAPSASTERTPTHIPTKRSLPSATTSSGISAASGARSRRPKFVPPATEADCRVARLETYE
jgi:hypothetical protein